MAVDRADHLPAVGLESLRRVVGEPARDLAVDRDAIVVVEADELAESPGTGERAGFVRDALHEATVAEEHPSVMIHDLVAGAIEYHGELLFGERHADGVRNPLPERARRGLDADVDLVLGVARGSRAELAEMLKLVHREWITRQVEHGIKEHRAMTIREHEAVAVGPAGIAGIVLQEIPPEHFGDVGHSHRHARMTGVGALNGIHAECPDGVGVFAAAGHSMDSDGKPSLSPMAYNFSMSGDFLFTSESVSEGHPDKVADQISDAVLDALLVRDPRARVACETLVKTGVAVVAGEITTGAWIDLESLVRGVICDIGYTSSEVGFDGKTCGVINIIGKQSADIAQGVDRTNPENTGRGRPGPDVRLRD